MPTISTFYGIKITMYFRQSEHAPPHFHAEYAGKKAVFQINPLKCIEGSLSGRAHLLVTEWATLHRDELLAIWNTQVFRKIEPLD